MPNKPTKYTPEFILKELRSMLRATQRNEEIIYIGSLYKDKPYPRQRMNEAIKKYNKIKQIPSIKKKIGEILEARIVERMANGKINAIVGMFFLKSVHKWIEQQHIKQDIRLDLSGSVVMLPRAEKSSE